MNETVLIITGKKNGGPGESQIEARILPPRPLPRGQEYSCEVSCTDLLNASKWIVGMDPDHAIEMARLFVLELFRHDGIEIVDEDSKPAP